MIARYLGSKTELVTPLIEEATLLSPAGGTVVDAFAGSLAASFGFKSAGFSVVSNDVNLFSQILGDAYLSPQSPPTVDVAATITNSRRRDELLQAAGEQVSRIAGSPGFTFIEEDDEWRKRYTNFVALLIHLQTMSPSDLPASARATHFFDSYCEAGANSAYVSSRGSTGRRRFFSAENAQRIDVILNQIRLWWRNSATDRHTHSLLLATTLRAVEKVSNTQGTYHDFPRETYDSRSLRPLTIDLPALDQHLSGPGGHLVARAQDSLLWAPSLDEHQILYLDPPYNFRQYSAYYFLPNVICRYPDLDDPGAYFDGIMYVRGQNPSDDFTSTFCKPSQFIGDLDRLIRSARSEAVLISYFDGANHWTKFDTDATSTGEEMLTGLLTSDAFEPGSIRVRRIPRRNYASYGGYKARNVNELLISARRRHHDASEAQPAIPRRVGSMAG